MPKSGIRGSYGNSICSNKQVLMVQSGQEYKKGRRRKASVSSTLVKEKETNVPNQFHLK
jgi:hypothetical protein